MFLIFVQEESRKRQVDELDQQLQSSHRELQSCQSQRQREVSELNRQLQQLQQLVKFK